MSFDLETNVWAGQSLTGPFLSFDTETTITSDHTIPTLVLASVSNGHESFIIHPDQIIKFLLLHQNQHLVGHNITFDFWVVHKHLVKEDHPSALTIWWDFPQTMRLHDTMLLDQLFRLAKGEAALGKWLSRGLDVCCKAYETEVIPDKESPFRKLYHTLLGADWRLVDPGFFKYALSDARGTWQLWDRLTNSVNSWLKEYNLHPNRKYGLLTEGLQVQGAIALAQVSRTGMLVDLERAKEVKQKAFDRLEETSDRLGEYLPTLFKGEDTFWGKEYERAPKSGARKKRTKVLKRFLSSLELKGRPRPVSCGKTGGMSLSAKLWKEHTDLSGALKTWVKFEEEAKHLTFFSYFFDYLCDDLRIRPRINPLLKTGRVAYSKPNLSQLPRSPLVRSIVVSRPKKVLLTIDYGAAELRTLAAECDRRFGFSALKETFSTRKDPHTNTAAMLTKRSYEEMLTLVNEEKSKKVKGPATTARQNAKACFHPDVEALTLEGWKRIADLTMDDRIAQYWPGTEYIDFQKPLALTTRENQSLVRIKNESIDLRVTPDHRMVGYRNSEIPVVTVPEKMNSVLRGIWNAGYHRQGIRLGSLTTEDVQRLVCVQADGSVRGETVVFGFTKTRKIERFQQLFPEAKGNVNKQGATVFRVRWMPVWDNLLTKAKVFRIDNLLKLTEQYRLAFLKELEHWDGHRVTRHMYSYGSVVKENVDAVQAVGSITGFKVTIHRKPSKSDNTQDFWTASVKERTYTRSGTFDIEQLEGMHQVYCLSVPSSFLLVRDRGKTVVTGNCNFGVPGGLSPRKLSSYAKFSYGVDLPEDRARVFIRKLTEEIYPEIGLYLADHTRTDLIRNLKVEGWQVEEVLNSYYRLGSRALRKAESLARGRPVDLTANEHDELWRLLQSLSRLSDSTFLKTAASKRQPSLKFWALLFGSLAETTTGRLRGACTYTQTRNTPFQSLAADGAKRALFELTKLGFEIVGFLHDELVIELPEETAKDQAAMVERIMVESMEEVMQHRVPVECEYTIGPCWAK